MKKLPGFKHSAPQEQKFWREFGAAWRAYCAGHGDLGRDAFREKLTRDALGLEPGEPTPSHKDFGNDELDLFFGQCLKYSQPNNVDEQIRLINGPIKRLLTGIEQCIDRLQAGGIKSPWSYANVVAGNVARKAQVNDEYGHWQTVDPDWRKWTYPQLRKLHRTLVPISRAKVRTMEAVPII